MNKNINFIGIGAQKAGTSWIFNQFEKSKQIDLPPIKELHYFDRSVEYPSPNILSEIYLLRRLQNPKWLSRAVINMFIDIKNFRWYWNWYFSNYTDDWYLSLYKDFKKTKGEITPAYAILKEEDVAKMSKLLGSETKIIFMVRNPIERAWSSYKYRFYTQNNNYRKFEEAKDFLTSDYQLLRSQYSKTINLYKKYFKTVFVGFFDSIIDDPKGLLISLFNYLELDVTEIDTFKGLDKRVNISNSMDMPTDIKDLLQIKYQAEINNLASNYGSYFLKWQNPNQAYESNRFKTSFIIQ